ncbi:hypothetical protein HN51_032713, partial [Arachis hypogaea]
GLDHKVPSGSNPIGNRSLPPTKYSFSKDIGLDRIVSGDPNPIHNGLPPPPPPNGPPPKKYSFSKII